MAQKVYNYQIEVTAILSLPEYPGRHLHLLIPLHLPLCKQGIMHLPEISIISFVKTFTNSPNSEINALNNVRLQTLLTIFTT